MSSNSRAMKLIGVQREENHGLLKERKSNQQVAHRHRVFHRTAEGDDHYGPEGGGELWLL